MRNYYRFRKVYNELPVPVFGFMKSTISQEMSESLQVRELLEFKNNLSQQEEVDEFDEESTVLCTPRSFAEEVKNEIKKHLATSSVGSNDSREQYDENLHVIEEQAISCLEERDSSKSPDIISLQTLNKGSIPAFECAKYVPKIGPKEYNKTPLPPI